MDPGPGGRKELVFAEERRLKDGLLSALLMFKGVESSRSDA